MDFRSLSVGWRVRSDAGRFVTCRRRGIVPQKMNITGGYMVALSSACLASSQARRQQRLPWMSVQHYLMCSMVSKDSLLVIRAISVKDYTKNSLYISILI